MTIGPNGHVSMDLTGRYQAQPEVDYYFTAATRLAPPTAFAPSVALAPAPVTSGGGVALALQYGAIEIGNGPVSYTVQVQTDGHAYQTVATTGKPFATVHEAAGHSHCVEGGDSFGDTSAWAVGSTVSSSLGPSPAIVARRRGPPQRPAQPMEAQRRSRATSTARYR